MDFGKFKDATSLQEGYKELEKAFTKKCQELASIKKVLEEKNEESSDLQPDNSGYNKEAPVENDEESAICEGKEDLTNLTETVNEKDAVKLNVDEKKVEDSVNSFTKREWKKEVSSFFDKNKDAVKFKKEIAEIIMNNSGLLLAENPLEKAYLLFLNGKPAPFSEINKIEEPVDKNKEVQSVEDYFDYLLKRKKACPKVISGQSDVVSSYKSPKPKSIFEAGEFVKRNYF